MSRTRGSGWRRRMGVMSGSRASPLGDLVAPCTTLRYTRASGSNPARRPSTYPRHSFQNISKCNLVGLSSNSSCLGFPRSQISLHLLRSTVCLLEDWAPSRRLNRIPKMMKKRKNRNKRATDSRAMVMIPCFNIWPHIWNQKPSLHRHLLIYFAPNSHFDGIWGHIDLQTASITSEIQFEIRLHSDYTELHWNTVYVYVCPNSHIGGLQGRGDLLMTSEVTPDLKFEFISLNNLFSSVYLVFISHLYTISQNLPEKVWHRSFFISLSLPAPSIDLLLLSVLAGKNSIWKYWVTYFHYHFLADFGSWDVS